MPELTEEEFAALEPKRTTYLEQDVKTFEYVDDNDNGFVHTIKMYDIQVGLKWIMEGGVERRYHTVRIEMPTVGTQLSAKDERFMTEFHNFVNPSEGYVYHVYMKVSTYYTMPYIEGEGYFWELRASSYWYNSPEPSDYLTLKAKGYDISYSAPKTKKERIVRSSQIFARSFLIYTTDLAHPKNAEWVDLAARVATCGRDVAAEPSDSERAEFDTHMDGFVGEVTALLLPGETF